MTIEIILNTITLMLVCYFTFIKKYFEKKGENLATKEDIAEITKLTEQSKVEFIKQIEDYKKELNLRYEFIESTKEYKIKLFQKTVNVRQNLIKWVNTRMTPTLIADTINLMEDIILDLYSNAILYKQYSSNHKNIEKEFNLLISAIQQGQISGNFNYSPSKLQNEFEKLQNELLK